MKNSSACYHAITEDSVQCYSSFRNQCKPLDDTSWLALISLPTHSRKKKCYLWILCLTKLTKSTSVSERERKKKVQQEKAGLLLVPKSPQSSSSKQGMSALLWVVGRWLGWSYYFCHMCENQEHKRENMRWRASLLCASPSDMEARSRREGKQGAFLVRNLA